MRRLDVASMWFGSRTTAIGEYFYSKYCRKTFVEDIILF